MPVACSSSLTLQAIISSTGSTGSEMVSDGDGSAVASGVWDACSWATGPLSAPKGPVNKRPSATKPANSPPATPISACFITPA